MRLPFCDFHICAISRSLETRAKPLDLVLSEYLREHKSIGAHDRRTIGETLYGMSRWKSLVDYFCPTGSTQERLACYRSLQLDQCQKDTAIPAPIRLGVTEYLYQKLIDAYGSLRGEELCRILNTSAPTTIRANLLKTTRDELLNKFETHGAFACSRAPHGIQFKKRLPLFSWPEFKQGLFEVQDEGSQLVAEELKPNPGDHVLDYCSGSGGKTLAFAPSMKGKGQIYLHDIRPWVLLEARKRLKRAGIQNSQCLSPGHPQLSRLQVDWALADVPCSGTGTLRRNPDAKWKIDAPLVERLVQEQRTIFELCLSKVKKGGKILYATCSLLPQENEEQTAYFLKSHSIALEKEPLFLSPQEGGMDGFYSALFRKI